MDGGFRPKYSLTQQVSKWVSEWVSKYVSKYFIGLKTTTSCYSFCNKEGISLNVTLSEQTCQKFPFFLPTGQHI